MKIDLTGLFCLTDEDGNEIPLTGKLGPALLAVVATSSSQSRSRQVLRAMLWPRSPDEQSSASLRTLLHSLRRALGNHQHHLVIGRQAVQLKGVELVPHSDPSLTFFENAPHLGEEFEDWLTAERSRARAMQSRSSPLRGQGPLKRRPVCVALYPPEVTADDPHANHIAVRILGQIRQHLCLMDMADVVDLSILDESGQSQPVALAQRLPDVALIVSLSKVGTFAEISVRAFDPATKTMYWSASISADQSSTFLFSSEQVDEFVNQAIDALNVACLRLFETGLDLRGVPQSIFGAVHKVLGMSVQGQSEARAFFRSKAELENSAIAAAWYAFSLANTLGEGGNQKDILEEADAYCRRAVLLDSSNALVLSLVAHVQGFVLRRLDVGAEMAKTAREIAPTLATAWDMSAMNAIYRGSIDEATYFSEKAVRLGRFSPYKPLFESSHAIANALAGNHTEAIGMADRVLARVPHFLAVQRHLSGSLAAVGRLDESRSLIRKIQARDPGFVATRLGDPDYPLPSPQSVKLLRRGFSSVGQIN